MIDVRAARCDRARVIHRCVGDRLLLRVAARAAAAARWPDRETAGRGRRRSVEAAARTVPARAPRPPPPPPPLPLPLPLAAVGVRARGLRLLHQRLDLALQRLPQIAEVRVARHGADDVVAWRQAEDAIHAAVIRHVGARLLQRLLARADHVLASRALAYSATPRRPRRRRRPVTTPPLESATSM